jgi:hypothetical protein
VPGMKRTKIFVALLYIVRNEVLKLSFVPAGKVSKIRTYDGLCYMV